MGQAGRQKPQWTQSATMSPDGGCSASNTPVVLVTVTGDGTSLTKHPDVVTCDNGWAGFRVLDTPIPGIEVLPGIGRTLAPAHCGDALGFRRISSALRRCRQGRESPIRRVYYIVREDELHEAGAQLVAYVAAQADPPPLAWMDPVVSNNSNGPDGTRGRAWRPARAAPRSPPDGTERAHRAASSPRPAGADGR